MLKGSAVAVQAGAADHLPFFPPDVLQQNIGHLPHKQSCKKSHISVRFTNKLDKSKSGIYHDCATKIQLQAEAIMKQGDGSALPKKDKALERLLRIPSDYTYDELTALLRHYEYDEYTGGATGGSRRRFVRKRDKAVIMLHKPHPGSIVNRAKIRDVIQYLKERGDIE